MKRWPHLAYRIGRITPITFSIAMNDYGFELLSDQPIPVDDTNVYELFSPKTYLKIFRRSVKSTEMARRKVRDIAVIGGLIFQGYPGEQKKKQGIYSLLLLCFLMFLANMIRITFCCGSLHQEVMEQQMEEVRLRNMLESNTAVQHYSHFSNTTHPVLFSCKSRQHARKYDAEKLEDRIKKMQAQLESG